MGNIEYQIRKMNPYLFSWAQSEMSDFSHFRGRIFITKEKIA
ncbi:hypothetical protein NZD88_03105 [Chryseobacterium antibioticum]|uniref:Uncharacterized protein n=1 Tax=Chryseobacterium pyrolae TaxID=2987481 RepID=A0ABT2ID34_9FLAO|nr:hypothetical protein [Chryseobacterium pyrolae]MCT2406541.1 hypothetical protein [Chryseobacterium pyrolae]